MILHNQISVFTTFIKNNFIGLIFVLFLSVGCSERPSVSVFDISPIESNMAVFEAKRQQKIKRLNAAEELELKASISANKIKQQQDLAVLQKQLTADIQSFKQQMKSSLEAKKKVLNTKNEQQLAIIKNNLKRKKILIISQSETDILRAKNNIKSELSEKHYLDIVKRISVYRQKENELKASNYQKIIDESNKINAEYQNKLDTFKLKKYQITKAVFASEKKAKLAKLKSKFSHLKALRDSKEKIYILSLWQKTLAAKEKAEAKIRKKLIFIRNAKLAKLEGNFYTIIEQIKQNKIQSLANLELLKKNNINKTINDFKQRYNKKSDVIKEQAKQARKRITTKSTLKRKKMLADQKAEITAINKIQKILHK